MDNTTGFLCSEHFSGDWNSDPDAQHFLEYDADEHAVHDIVSDDFLFSHTKSNVQYHNVLNNIAVDDAIADSFHFPYAKRYWKCDWNFKSISVHDIVSDDFVTLHIKPNFQRHCISGFHYGHTISLADSTIYC